SPRRRAGSTRFPRSRRPRESWAVTISRSSWAPSPVSSKWGCKPMADVDPAIIAERLLRLKRTRPFDGLDTQSLSMLASAGREMVCSTTTRLAAEGERSSAHWVVLTGRLQALRRGEPLPGDPIEEGFGGLSLLTELPLPVDLIAEAGTVLFVLDADALIETP